MLSHPIRRALVAEIEAQQAMVAATGELIRHTEAEGKDAIDRVWGVPAYSSLGSHSPYIRRRSIEIGYTK